MSPCRCTIFRPCWECQVRRVRASEAHARLVTASRNEKQSDAPLLAPTAQKPSGGAA